MKNLLITAILALTSLNVYSANAIFNSDTKIVNIPVVEVNGAPALSDVQLKMRADGLFELVGYENYTAGDAASLGVVSISGNINVGSVFKTFTDVTIIVTGFTDSTHINIHYNHPQQSSFKDALSHLPEPLTGTRGQYYAVIKGSIVWVNVL